MMARWLFAMVMMAIATPAVAAPPGWELVWSDDFDTFDDTKWEKITSFQPTNNSLHAYLPQQVSVEDGKLVILSENVPAGGLPYRSGQVFSKSAQRLGRWEVRARLPTTRGMWPAIWLLPDTGQYPWPSQGEIDIMENRGNQPTITSSAFHWGTNPPFSHSFVYDEQQTSLAGQLVNYADDYHTYAVDWYEDRLQFYVDDVNYYTIHNQDIQNFLTAQQTAPMQLVINTAIGGDFLPNPNASTVWPQRFYVDWVRVYERSDSEPTYTFQNGGFEANGGSLAGWTLFGNHTLPNVLVHNEAVLDGQRSLKIFGGFTGGTNYSGVAQGITVEPGQQVRAQLDALVRAADSLAGTDNTVSLKIEFYDRFGAKFDSPQLLDFEEITIANSATPNDQWQRHELIAQAPAGAIEARVAVVFTQPGTAGGAIHIDAIQFGLYDAVAAAGDYNRDGRVDAGDYVQWRNSLGDEGTLLPADGSGDGRVGVEDYGVWKANYGRDLQAEGAGGVSHLVPEPPPILPLVAWALAASLRQARQERVD